MWLLAVLILADAEWTGKVPVSARESLAVAVAGVGAPVVLVPGLFGSVFGFRHLTPQLLAAGFRTIVVEPLGVGGSSRPAGADYSLEAQARRLGAVLDSLGVRGAVVVAHSMGAAIALRLAVHRPDLVDGIVSLDGGPAESAVSDGFRRAMRYAPLVRLVGGVGLVRRKIREYLIVHSGDASWVNDTVVLGYTADAARDLGATLRAYRTMAGAREPGPPLAGRLSEVRCPVVLLVGTNRRGTGVRPEEVLLLRERLGAFAMDSIPGAGHFLHEERPEVVVHAVTALLRRRLTAP